MKPLVVLLAIFVITMACTKLFAGDWNIVLAGNAGMSVMLLFTAIGHFKFSKGMSMMLPPVLPFRTTLIYITGLTEIAGATGLMIPSLRHITTLLLVVFFITVLPANIYAAIEHVDFEKGTNKGKGPGYLWFRVPLQVLFIAWVWYFGMS